MRKSGLILVATILSVVLLFNSYPISAAEDTIGEITESSEKDPGGTRSLAYIGSSYSTVCTAHGCNNRYTLVGALLNNNVVDIRMIGYDGGTLWTGSAALNSGNWSVTLWTGTDVARTEARVRDTQGGYVYTVTLSVETNV